MSAVLHVISDRTRHRSPLLEALGLSAEGGADVIQIREKKAPVSETYSLVTELQRQLFAKQQSPALFVNDRVDVAFAANLAGVHLASKSLPIPVVDQLRRRVNWSGQIGCSVHSLDEALAAEQAGVDYVTFGHIYASESHPGMPPRGLYALRRVVEALSIPVIAIGGIDRSNLAPVLETNCSGVAVIGAVLNAANPLEATRALKEIMNDSTALPKIPFVRHQNVSDKGGGL
ncbi:thiamine phosphate synthase [Alicyclobacillus ferrooxydans]|uniref:Thiamine-phosphate synthase n=1 Tax=Alicyclobacillus ferrooxydans TaxID=471514 RepID=A0A0P9EEX5_9BACL|nr:thiamine phosphate synthase [Alicyclobacillus ferrooxydans]KPV40891.1 thiamine-phosphate diphosphorylase [Alicyclobacillus ferrooxydans]